MKLLLGGSNFCTWVMKLKGLVGSGKRVSLPVENLNPKMIDLQCPFLLQFYNCDLDIVAVITTTTHSLVW